MTRLAHVSTTKNKIFLYLWQEVLEMLVIEQQLPAINQLLLLLGLGRRRKHRIIFLLGRSPRPAAPPRRYRLPGAGPGHRRALTGAGPAATAPGPCVSRVPSPPQRPSDPHRLPGHDAAQLGLEAPHGPCGLGAEAQVGVAPRGAAHQQRDPRPLRHDAHLRRCPPPPAPFIPPASPRPPAPARWPQPIG